MKLGLKKEAIRLRKKGFSFREISKKLKISKSTASLWLGDVELSAEAKDRIQSLSEAGRKNAAKTVKNRIEREDLEILKRVKESVENCSMSKSDLKVVCALLYWCEGGKTDKAKLSFINSNPKLVEYFIDTFRKAFDIDEKRFRALIHLHEYHDIHQQTKFWSNLTRIPKKQFSKPYNKPNTGKQKKNGYQGCISVRYYGRKIRQEMMFLIDEISKENMRA